MFHRRSLSRFATSDRGRRSQANVYVYSTNDDAAAVQAAGYFDNARATLRKGDILTCTVAADTAPAKVELSVVDVPLVGNITVALGGGGGATTAERAISARGQVPYQIVPTPTGKTTTKSRLKFKVREPVTRYRFAYCNKALSLTGGEVNGPNAVTIRKAAGEVNGVFDPILFGGSRSRVVAVGELMATSDWVNRPLAKGDILWFRQIADYVASATSYAAGRLYQTASLEGGLPEQSWIYDPAFETDDVDGTGTLASPSGTTANYQANYIPFAPVMLIGELASGIEVVLGVGDSIAFGLNDVPSSDGSIGNGFIARAAAMKGRPYTAFALSGQTVQQIIANHTMLDALLPYHTTVVSEAGTNDIGTNGAGANAAFLHSQKVTEWGLYAGKRILQTKLTPRVTQVDYGTTLAGQTVITGHDTGQVRDQTNALYAADAGTLIAAFVDVATPIEAPGVPSKWAPVAFTANLTALAATTAVSLVMDASPPLGSRLVVDVGGANAAPVSPFNANTRAVSVTGAGPYTATFSSAIGGAGAHQIGEVVKISPSDGTHPEGPVNALLAAPLAALLAA